VAEPFLADIKLFGFNFVPRGWAACDGQILPINQNQSLYSLLGTTYGGDGRTTFALPDLRGRTPMHVGNGGGHSVVLGEKSGSETHALTTNELPSHRHVVSSTGDQGSDTNIAGITGMPNNVLASQARGGDPFYSAAAGLDVMDNRTIADAGGGQPHNNMQPILTVTFAIAIQGVFPSRN